MRLPLTDIDPHALIRDRSVLDPAALAELQASIAANGLRQPVEVFATDTGYALLSGYRRYMAHSALAETDPRFAQIDATLRAPADHAKALAAMVEENEIRQALSAWERAAIAVAATDSGAFPTLDAALAGLYPFASKQKRSKLRAVVEVIDALDGLLTDPESLTESRLLRLSGVLRLGWSDLLEAALREVPGKPPATQWDILRPVLEEAESLLSRGRPTSPDRPRRLSRPRPGVVIRREKTRAGYLLHVTGHGASDALVGEVLEEIERMFGEG